MEGRIHGALFELEGLRAAPLRLLDDLVAVHRALAEQREQEHADCTG
jgi:hypothetical protein